MLEDTIHALATVPTCVGVLILYQLSIIFTCNPYSVGVAFISQPSSLFSWQESGGGGGDRIVWILVFLKHP